MTRRRHEVRDETGRLIAVIEIVGDASAAGPTMIELAADLPSCGYRVRLFPAIEDIERPRRVA